MKSDAITEQIIAGSRKEGGKDYSFNEDHDETKPSMMWFQESNEGKILFVVFCTSACRWSQCSSVPHVRPTCFLQGDYGPDQSCVSKSGSHEKCLPNRQSHRQQQRFLAFFVVITITGGIGATGLFFIEKIRGSIKTLITSASPLVRLSGEIIPL